MPGKPFSSMPSVLKRRSEQIIRNTSGVVKQASSTIHREIVLGTPVDEGVARSNWIVTKNEPTSQLIPAYSPGVKLGRGEVGNAEAAIAQGLSVITTFDANSDKSVEITNNVGYVGLLNTPPGTSAQAPGGLFVEKGIQRGLVSIRGRKLLAT